VWKLSSGKNLQTFWKIPQRIRIKGKKKAKHQVEFSLLHNEFILDFCLLSRLNFENCTLLGWTKGSHVRTEPPPHGADLLLSLYLALKKKRHTHLGWGRGQEGEMTQTIYEHVNKWILKKEKNCDLGMCLLKWKLYCYC
jgi:hypothetical protein